MKYELSGKSVGIIGLARTGLAVAEVVVARGGQAVIFDAKDAVALGESVARAADIGASVRAGVAQPDLTGIDLVVTSPGVPLDKMGIPEAVSAGIEVIGEIELAYRIAQAPIAAITGTNGKTTTTVLVGLILREAGFDTFIAGNAAGTGLVSDNRTIMPLVMAAHRASKDSRIIAEISSFQLETISSFAPFVGAVLNVTSDHLDRYDSVQAYTEAKARLCEHQSEQQYSVVNADDAVAAGFARLTRGHVLEFSRSRRVREGAYVDSGNLVAEIGGKKTVLCSIEEILLPGEHNVENMLAGGMIALLLGAEPEHVRKVARSFSGVRHRMEFVGVKGHVRYINNSMCTNVDAAIRSIESIEVPVIVICGGRDKKLDYSRLIETFKSRVKHAILLGEAATTLGDYCVRAGYESFDTVGTMAEAVILAGDLARAGDTVLLAPVCSSFDMYGSFEERGDDFRNIVSEL